MLTAATTAIIWGIAKPTTPNERVQAQIFQEAVRPIQTATANPLQSANSPRTFKFKVTVAAANDLKIRQGDAINQGQVIADRTEERSQLLGQQKQVQLNLKKIEGSKLIEPLAPIKAPQIAAPPSPSYLQFEAQIRQAQIKAQQEQEALDLKQRELDFLKSQQGTDPIVFEHELAVQRTLESKREQANEEISLAQGKLAAAQQQFAYQQYEHTIQAAQRVEQANQANLQYQQQLARYQEQLREKDFQVSQLSLKLGEINERLQAIAVIKAPYSGVVRRVKPVGGADGRVEFEITLAISPPGSSPGAAQSQGRFTSPAPGSIPFGRNNGTPGANGTSGN
jgi:hypothetical protein